MSAGIVKYPPYINTVSIFLGKLRDLYNSELNEKDARFKRGNRSEYVNILGIKGELIMQHYLFANNHEYTAADFLGGGPQKIPDIVVNGCRVDVKTIRTDAPDLLVSVAAHKKGRDISHYCFVQCTDDTTARFWYFSYADVSSWPVKNCKYTDSHYKPIAEITEQ